MLLPKARAGGACRAFQGKDCARGLQGQDDVKPGRSGGRYDRRSRYGFGVGMMTFPGQGICLSLGMLPSGILCCCGGFRMLRLGMETAWDGDFVNHSDRHG